MAAPRNNPCPDTDSESLARQDCAGLAACVELFVNDNLPPIISIKTAAAMTSLSRPLINVMRAQGAFPAAVQLGERRIGFVRSEVVDWIQARIAARDMRSAA